ncbi:RcpC/CpaB family pilus assembly protein [Streptomyces marincola]|uniref:RcpC/CpaB family pilus assembly protein n=1 Tax=Streptomyces marincola TaxID=2878388 RepID=UPI0020FFFD62|nr:RcpC/CpaB family pilus assembly protein [Streptomyces marincola]
MRPRGGRWRLRRAARRHRRRLAAVLALASAAVAFAVPRGERTDLSTPAAAAAREGPSAPARDEARVLAPVRIADAEAVRLLRPGDRVDVLAATAASTAGTSGAEARPARVVARRARVADVPEQPPAEDVARTSAHGALLVLSVPPGTAAALAGAAATADLAVTRW